MPPKPTLTLQSRAGPAAQGRGQAHRLPVMAAVIVTVVGTITATIKLLVAAVAAAFMFTNTPYTANNDHACHVGGVKDRGRSQKH